MPQPVPGPVVRRRGLEVAPQELCPGREHRQRCAQFVAGVGDELTLAAQGRDQPAHRPSSDHGTEGGSEQEGERSRRGERREQPLPLVVQRPQRGGGADHDPASRLRADLGEHPHLAAAQVHVDGAGAVAAGERRVEVRAADQRGDGARALDDAPVRTAKDQDDPVGRVTDVVGAAGGGTQLAVERRALPVRNQNEQQAAAEQEARRDEDRGLQRGAAGGPVDQDEVGVGPGAHGPRSPARAAHRAPSWRPSW